MEKYDNINIVKGDDDMSKLKYKLLTTLSFGDELNSILKYYGVNNCNLFLKPN